MNTITLIFLLLGLLTCIAGWIGLGKYGKRVIKSGDASGKYFIWMARVILIIALLIAGIGALQYLHVRLPEFMQTEVDVRRDETRPHGIIPEEVVPDVINVPDKIEHEAAEDNTNALDQFLQKNAPK